MFNKFYSFLKKKPGFFQLITRLGVFFGILFVLYFLLFVWIRHLDFFVRYLRIDDGFYISWLSGLRKTDFLNAIAFSVIGFVIWNREKLFLIGKTVRSKSQTIIFGVFSAIAFCLHYVLKFFVAKFPQTVNYVYLITFSKYFLLSLFVVFLAYSVFTKEMIHKLFVKFKKSILSFLGIGVVYFFLIQFFQHVWYYLSYFVSVVIRELLRLSFDKVLFSAGSAIHGPRLGAGGFFVGISNECSGIDSLLLFISLYGLLLVLDWRRMHIKRMLLLFIPGLIGTVAYNILRIYSLILVGVYIDPDFAINMFHTNAGWILFLIFFVIFWHFGSKWVYKKKKMTGGSGKKRDDKSKKTKKKLTKK